MLHKNKTFNVYIEDMSAEGQGIGKFKNFIIFVENAIEGDYCEIKIVKVKKNYAYAKLLNILKESSNRAKPICKLYNRCGGCNLQHLNYDAQLNFKMKKVKGCLTKIGGFSSSNIENIIENIIFMKNPYRYRNKAQFPVGIFNGKFKVGFYEKCSHNIIHCDDCIIQNKVNKEIISIVLTYMQNYNIMPYNENTGTGIIRHIITRIGFFSDEIMVCLVVNANKDIDIINAGILVDRLLKISKIKSIVLNFNKVKTNVILGKEISVLYGNNYIIDFIDNLKFKISLLSFYQVNPVQTEFLYKKILDLANLSKNDIVIDIYCGIGTIGLFIAKYVKKVYGIEIVKEAILDAKINSEINNITNIEFIEGKAENIIYNFCKMGINLDLVILDPPRKGCHIDLINSLLNLEPKKIIYVSCDPSTLSRDLKILCKTKYILKKVIPYDMFPQTYHVEVVALLVKV